MSGELLIGVDGGNTKTVALAARPDGSIAGGGRAGCADIHNASSVEVALDAIAAACQDALFEAGAAAADVQAACFNLAGADWPEDIELLGRAIPELVGLRCEPLVVNDAIAPIRAGTVDGAGVSVVCGTFGTTAARNPEGRTYHVGFWPDMTGGRGLGRDGLAAVWRSGLGLGPETALTARALTEYAVDSPIVGNEMMWTIPPMLYGIFRYLYLIYDRSDDRSTAAIVAEDRGIIAAGAVFALTAFLLLYVFN